MFKKDNKYDEILNEMPSLKKLYDEINAMNVIKVFISKKKQEEFIEIKENLYNMLDASYKYNLYFSDLGWILYGSLNIEFVKECIIEFENNGMDKAEDKIVNYYLNNVDKKFYFKSNLFRARKELLNQGLDAHFCGDFYKSIPIFLIIADSVINEYTKSKGFFTENVDISCWDSITGLTSGLIKIKDIYNSSRKKTNYEEIKFPYRNGILHGRDLNFANKYVSCKSLVLLLALDNWILDKESEEIRKDKYEKESNPPPISDSIKKLKRAKESRKLIESYKKKEYSVNKDFPETGCIEDYKIEFMKPVIIAYDLLKKKNYGYLSDTLTHCLFGKNKGEKIESCKEKFKNKSVNGFRIINVDDYSISMKKIVIEFNYENGNELKSQKYEIGVIYFNGDEISIPNYNDGSWEISYMNEIND